MTGRQSGPEIAGQIGLGLALLAAAGFRWAIAGRGLDFTDESFALLAAGHPEEVRVSPSLFSFYIAPLFTLAEGILRRFAALVS